MFSTERSQEHETLSTEINFLLFLFHSWYVVYLYTFQFFYSQHYYKTRISAQSVTERISTSHTTNVKGIFIKDMYWREFVERVQLLKLRNNWSIKLAAKPSLFIFLKMIGFLMFRLQIFMYEMIYLLHFVYLHGAFQRKTAYIHPLKNP